MPRRCGTTFRARFLGSTCLLIGLTTLEGQPWAQSLQLAPPEAFVPSGQGATFNMASTAASGALPAEIVVLNLLDGFQSSLNLAILPGSAPAELSGGPFAYAVRGIAAQDTNDGSIPGSYVNGPTLTVTNTASLSLANPTNGTNAAILAFSAGAPGYAQQKHGAQAAIYNAGFGGTVSAVHDGSLGVSGNTSTAGSGLAWLPFLSAVSVISRGGDGAAAKADDDDFAGNGGNGGVLSVTTGAGSTINLQGTVASGSFINGITAYSQGGLPGALTSGDHANLYGASGAGGAITISHAGAIASNASNSIGIAAASIGGAGGEFTGGGVGTAPGISGPGGAVSIGLAGGGSIAMASGNAIGIFAASAVGPSLNSYGGSAITGGPVTVTVDQGASITTGNGPAGGRFGIGVLAISTGSAATLAPFADTAVSIGGSGYSGAVTVANAGNITASGQLALGIAALSVGGAGIVTNAASGALSYLGTTANTDQPARGGQVAVTNTGSITTNGASAFGILAASTGAGGLIGADANATFAGRSATSGVVLGTVGSTGNSNPGGAVTVANAGTIMTGDGQGGGRLAIGIIAQSIGGGGGSTGGGGAAAFIGDAGGNGGNGGAVTVTHAGSTTTRDDGAIGILAQSVGGGGGQGGNAAGVFVAVGGQGGSGGSGGPVDVTLGTNGGGAVVTSGDFAAGVLAQSIGGGGGSGGFGTSAGLFVDVAIGGAGGSGGDGGTVTFTNTQTLTTAGQAAHGLVAQSVGGGGGNGGAATAYTAGAIFTTTLAIGGTGGTGGSGGTVTVNNNYHIATRGPDAVGLVAQSIGGGGGTGGASTAKSFSISLPDVPSVAFTAALGGNGSGGGNGGSVTIANAGRITTLGHGAHGLLAQSIGGGGGNGGDSTATSRSLPVGGASVQFTLALGADGGSGGTGGPVTVTSGSSNDCGGCASHTLTGGNGAAGILAQSIGGGGGNSTAGNASNDNANIGSTLTGSTYQFSLGLGASGGLGGTGGAVQVTLGTGNTIVTQGSGSPGILAQSIAGGGGTSSGGSFGASFSVVKLNLSAGGNGVAGSTGGAVTITNGGTIATRGGDSIGILAQSIAGGGGLAGSSDAAASVSRSNQAENILSPPQGSTYEANLAIGGRGGGGGNAGSVTVTNTGTILTAGIRAHGIEAQSIGGGGGHGGTATSTAQGTTNATFSSNVAVGGGGGIAGDGGLVSVTSAGPIGTRGYGAHGILAQSIGGGGGAGADGSVGASTTLSLGAGVNGQGGGSGTAQDVSVTTQAGGAIATRGDDALGILAQSIGGGGGTAGGGCTNSGGGGTACFGNTGASSTWLPNSLFNISVGGGSGAGGNGNTVTVGIGDAINTQGARAMGVVAQSIGGGGGYAAAAAATISGTTVAGSPGANGATGGPVTVTLAATGSIATRGAGAWGILAQSIGGGGGFAGDPSLPLVTPAANTLARTTAGNAFANTVRIDLGGSIATTGANAHGVFAQAVGGSGGLVAGCCQSTTAQLLAGNTAQLRGGANATFWGDGGAIIITQSAGSTVSTTGQGSIGIVAQSSGNAAAVNPITITVGGIVSGGTNGGAPVPPGLAGAAGILVSGGGAAANPNLVTVSAGGSITTADGVAGAAIVAGSGTTEVANSGTVTGSILLGATPGTITNNPGGTLNLGATVVASALTNNGTMLVQPGTTTLSGNFAQGSGGVYSFAFDGQSSHTLVVGGSAAMGGAVVPVVGGSLLPFTDTILSAGSIASLTPSTPQTLLFGWLVQQDGNRATISPSANFLPSGVPLDASQASLARYLGRAWAQADPAFAARFAYLYNNVSSASAYADTLTQSSPRTIQGPAMAMLNAAGSVLGAAMSCPRFEGEGTLLGEGSCLWAKVGGQVLQQHENGGRVSGIAYRIGGQTEFAPGWFVGGSLSTGTIRAEDGSGRGTGQTHDGSIALKRMAGPLLLAGSVAVGGGSYQHQRMLTLPGLSATLRSDSGAVMVGGRLRAAYDLPIERWYLRPYLDLDLVHVATPAFAETGGAGAALAIRPIGTTRAAASPMIQFGGRLDVRDGMVVRYHLDVGASFHARQSRNVEASFVGASPADGVFQTVLRLPTTTANIDLGVQVYQRAGLEVRADYTMRAGAAFLSQGGSFRLGYQF